MFQSTKSIYSLQDYKPNQIRIFSQNHYLVSISPTNVSKSILIDNSSPKIMDYLTQAFTKIH
jgi:hypothetical protein